MVLNKVLNAFRPHVNSRSQLFKQGIIRFVVVNAEQTCVADEPSIGKTFSFEFDQQRPRIVLDVREKRYYFIGGR